MTKIWGQTPFSNQFEPVELNSFVFSGGEVQVRLGDLSGYEGLGVEACITNSQELMETLLILGAIKEAEFQGPVRLEIPYLPYSRQDRCCYPGEAFSLSVFSGLFKQLLYSTDTLVTWDVHSKVAYEQFKFTNFKNVTVDHFIKAFIRKGETFHKGSIIVAPDKGAVERANLAAKALGCTEVLYGQKVRNPDNGEILGIGVLKEKEPGNPASVTADPNSLAIEGKPVLIVDDICDGGRTFIELAKSLRTYNPASIDLYVTHGIFSKGFEVFAEEVGKSLIDRFFVPNLFPKVSKPYPPFCNVITL